MYYVGTIIENKKQEFLLEQRPETGLLANMWLFPIEEISKNNFNNCKTGATSRNGKQLTLELEPVTEPLVAEEPVNFLRTMKQLSGKTYLRRSRSYFQSFKMAYLSLLWPKYRRISHTRVAAMGGSTTIFRLCFSKTTAKMVELFKKNTKK